MEPRIILDSQLLSLTIDRLCHQLIEQHSHFADSIIVGVQPRGVQLSARIHHRLSAILAQPNIPYGKLDITFHRDDFRQKGKATTASETDMPLTIEGKNIILIDDVLYTGRTIRAALDALQDYGRPNDVELLVLIDRRLHRHVPIQAKYIGRVIDSINTEKVKVEWAETDGHDAIWILDETHHTT
jgi:pyrimidine operon attenuation protein / uracil phosphoribosyltransferase